MFALFRFLAAIACFSCSLTALGQEISLEELFNSNSNQEDSSEEAAARGEAKLRMVASVTVPDTRIMCGLTTS